MTANNSLLKIPSHTVSNSRKVWTVIKEYEEEFGVEPTNEEISEIMGLSVKHVKQAINSLKTKYVASIDTPVRGDEGGRTLSEIIPDNQTDVEQMLDNAKIREVIVDSLKGLSKREELVLRLRFGISEVDKDDTNVYDI